MNRQTPLHLAFAVQIVLHGGSAQAASLEQRMRQMEAKMQQMEQQLARSQQENTQLKQQLAQPPATPADDALERVTALDRKIEQDKKAAAEAAKTTAKLELTGNGVTFKSADDNYKLRLSGYAQADSRFYEDNDSVLGSATGINDQFLIRRARLSLEGTLFKFMDFRFAPDFAAGTPRLFDAFVDLHYFNFAALQIGKQRVPSSLERYQTAPNLAFIERGYPAEISPNRDTGVMLHGYIPYPGYKAQYTVHPMFKEWLSYEVGVFSGTRDNQGVQTSEGDRDNNKEIAARLFSHPFMHAGIPALEGLGIGISGTWGHTKNNNLPNLTSLAQNPIVSYTGGAANTLATGESYRIYPQMYWYYGPVSFLGEYVLSSQELQAGARKTKMDNEAWQAQVSYMLTGEKATFFAVKPTHHFDPPNGQWGALQLAARWTELDIDDSIFQNYGTAAAPVFAFANPALSVSHASTWSLGLNWFLNTNFKFAVNYDQTAFKGGAGTGITPLSRDMERVLMTRMQFQF